MSTDAALGVFPPEEYDARVHDVREVMAAHDLDALLLTSPENIYYLVGLSHQGYFAFTMLLFRIDGPPLLVTRSMERVTVTEQAPHVEHVGFADHEDAAGAVVEAVERAGLAGGRLGIECDNMFFPPRVWDEVHDALPDVDWHDGSGVVEEIRLVKSVLEVECSRQAAAISDRAMRAAIQTAGVGVNEREVAAETMRSLILGGSEHPGFVPLVRSQRFLLHEHSTWSDHVLVPGDALFVELSASVARYHSPLTRMVYVGREPAGVERSAELAAAGLDAVLDALVPGRTSGEVYAAWEAVVHEALGHERYRRHHCGYSVGIGFPPSWVGGSTVIGLRPGGEMEIRERMVFHVLSWILGTELTDSVISDTVLVTPEGGELLTSTTRTPLVIA